MTNRDYALEEFFRSEMIDGTEVLIGLDKGDIPNGTQVVKVNSEPGDTHQDGTLGTVVGAWEVTKMAKAKLKRLGKRPAKWVYWVKFVALPEVPMAIADYRIKR
ncbi:MAG: hypothetical protein GH156_00500 [Dehalococcoidia bacterium]|nr:hypothetical protein [Dehalococcoidia bacterium]